MISEFFQIGSIPANYLTGTYDWGLVLLSYFVAILVSYAILDIVGRLQDSDATPLSRAWWQIGGAFAMGAGIWSMHFISLLSFVLTKPTSYDPTLTTLSLLIAILASALALSGLKAGNFLRVRLFLSGLILGFGIAAMHYLGMSAMNLTIHYRPSIFILSILIACLAAEAVLGLALKCCRGSLETRLHLKLISAIAVGAALCGMQYTGMLAAVFTPSTTMFLFQKTFNPEFLAVFLALTALFILGMTLAASAYKEILNYQVLAQQTIQLTQVLSFTETQKEGLFMTTQQQLFVLGSDGNLWLETGPFGNVAQTTAKRLPVDGNVSKVYSQVSESRIWRTAFQALSATEVFVLGSDGKLWLENSPFGNISQTIAKRLAVDANVQTFQVMDINTVFVLGTDGNLWLETAPFGDISQVIAHRQQVDANVLAFQALDTKTVFVLGTDGNLWLETAPFGNVSQVVANRLQVDSNVSQFWAMDQGTVYVLGSDLNFWYEPGPFGNPDITTSIRTQIDSNVNDFQPLRISSEGGGPGGSSAADIVFVLGHDGNLWMVQGPYEGVAKTVASRQFVDSNVIAFGADNPSDIFVLKGDLSLWYEFTPFGPANSQQIDANVVACQPLYNQQLFAKHLRPVRVSAKVPEPA